MTKVRFISVDPFILHKLENRMFNLRFLSSHMHADEIMNIFPIRDLYLQPCEKHALKP